MFAALKRLFVGRTDAEQRLGPPPPIPGNKPRYRSVYYPPPDHPPPQYMVAQSMLPAPAAAMGPYSGYYGLPFAYGPGYPPAPGAFGYTNLAMPPFPLPPVMPPPVMPPPATAVPSAPAPLQPPVPAPKPTTTSIVDLGTPSPYQWMDGDVSFECILGNEPPGWADQGWVFRSSGSRARGVPAGATNVDKSVSTSNARRQTRAP
uniref:Uncharacterized protein n=1 Tax=Mycena chlorophos TaxID=658473 RepID=A0ABQ0L5I1_MYCCL|nr:predicted protein [Mycena chlorophos]